MKKFIVLHYLLSALLLAQVTNPEWRNFTNSETTRSIAEEGEYLWLGTDGGLVKINKLTQQQQFFNKGNSILPSNHIRAIVIDNEGYKWLCTNNGLVKFKDAEWFVYKKDNSGLPSNKLTCITIDNGGNKWIGTVDSGLVMYDDENWIVYNQQNSTLNSNIIRALKTDNSVLWIGTLNGFYKRENNDFTYITIVGNRYIRCIEKDVHGNIWIGTANGLIRLIGIDTVDTFSSLSITSLGIDNHNVKWFGSINTFSSTGAMRNIDSADTQVTYNYVVNSATSYPWFHSMLLDPSGVNWFGSENGLVRVDGNGQFINVSNSALGRGFVTKFFIDKNDRKWFYAWGPIPLTGTILPPGYLTSLASDTWTAYTLANSPIDIGGVAAISDFYGTDMFVAKYDVMGNTELYKFSSGIWTQLTVPQTQYDLILFMWFDEVTGRLWVDFQGANGQNNLFYTYNGYSWNPVPSYPVYDINKMKRLGNVIWIASPQGLIKYSGGIFTLYNTSNSGLPHNYVSSLDFDSQGNVWAGTKGGLAKYDGTNWTIYDRNNSPLSCDNISGLVIDQAGNIFLGTEKIGYPNNIPAIGVVKFDGTNWTFLNSNNSGKPDTPDGSEDINDLSIDASGKIWIATDGGVGVYDKNGIPIPVELISFNSSVIGNDVQLNWTTATETNNSGFEIERAWLRSSNYAETSWETIGFVPGFGTTTEPKTYSFIDENVSSGTYKYRLKQIDFDGSFTYSNEIEVDFTPKEFVLYQNFPNPFNPNTVISYQLPVSGNVTLKVYDILGNEVATLVNEEKQPGVYEVEFNINSVEGRNLTSGVYFYQLIAKGPETSSGQSFVQTKKMLLLK